MHGYSVKRIAQAAAVLLLTYSALIRADNCAGGMDVTGNDCNPAQSAPSLSNAAPSLSNTAPSLSNARSPSKGDTRILFAKRAETVAQSRLAAAKIRQDEAAATVKIAEAALLVSRKAVADAQYRTRR